ncbi:MAG: hypothetical protein FJY77_01435 [Candidatus Altiarchaeales archaeon]|nr:hypothetical protein [Candidatus Altiarchaeales archaeon]
MKHSTALAFPGLPIIFAEGFKSGRVSMHGHISVALTDLHESVKTETRVSESNIDIFHVGGKILHTGRGKGMASIIDLMRRKSERGGHLKVLSRNHGILSGSSDSGAAALVVALNKFLDLGLSASQLHEIARHGSETAYRSLYGGLSEYYFSRHSPHARTLLHAEELRDIVVYAVPFNYPRYNADVLHMNIVQHPHYKKRVLDVERRLHEFKSHLVERDFSRCLQLMEDDAREVHGMFESLELTVRKEKMLELCHKIEQWRGDGLECYWNVAGASVVYVFTLHKHRRKLSGRLAEYKPVEYKIAGPARVL